MSNLLTHQLTNIS